MKTTIDLKKKASLRDAYGEVLLQLGKVREDIVVLDADLSSSTRTSLFAKQYPERFFNMGIAEADMIGTAAGLSLYGKKVFLSTFAMFATGRPWEQIRQSICIDNRDVVIVATHAGITVGEDGPTHQAMEDIAILRPLPNMRIIVPADANQTKAAVKFAAYDKKGPIYIRLSREKFPLIYEDDLEFKLGKADILLEGEDVAIIATGIMVSEGYKAVELLREDDINPTLVNIPTIKPIDEAALLDIARRHKLIITAEEGSKTGGLGSAVAEFLSANHPVRIIRVGMDLKFGKSGSPSLLLKEFGMDQHAIADAVRKSLRLKNS